MSAIKSCTVLVMDGSIDSYHIDSDSAYKRADKLLNLWKCHWNCGSKYPRPKLQVMTANEFIKSRQPVDF